MFSSPAIYRFTDDSLEERAAMLQSETGVSRVEVDATILREFPNADRQRVFRVAINKHFVDKTGDYELLNSRFLNSELTLDELLQNITAGHAICPAILTTDNNGRTRRNSESWAGSELVMLDVDRGMSIEDFEHHELARFALATYTTLNHKPEHHRFRILFALPGIITDSVLYRRIVSSLIRRLGADESRKDVSSAFFGNRNAQVTVFQDNGNQVDTHEFRVLPESVINDLLASESRESPITQRPFEVRDIGHVVTATQLLEVGDDDRYLWHPLLRSQAAIALVGLPDSTKSFLARNLALAIVCGLDEYLGMPLKPFHRRVLIVATEDGAAEIGRLLKRPCESMSLTADSTDRLHFIFMSDLSSQELFKLVEDFLSTTPVDLIIIDGFGDIHIGEQNSNSDVRTTLRIISALATRYVTCIVIIHHLTKAGYSQSPAHMHVSGGSAFVQKVRAVLELRNGEDNEKFLIVTKGNYVPATLKSSAWVLQFDDETFLHFDSGERIALEDISQSSSSKSLTQSIDWSKFFNPPNGRFTTKVLLHWLLNNCGVGRTQAYKRIGEAISEGLIRKESLGRETFYLATGLLVGSDARPPP